MRTFIALSLPSATRNALGDVASKMIYQDKSNAVRWTDQENYHVTLAFLGEQPPSVIDRLADELDYELSSYGVDSKIRGVSPFPETKPKLIAAMLQPTDSLLDVHKQVLRATNNTKIAFEKRRFIPHITLGRLRHSRNPYAGTIPLAFELELDFDEVVLYESHLRSNGAEYEPIFRYPLGFDDYLEDIE